MTSIILVLVSVFGGGVAVAIIVGYVVLMNPEKFQIWSALIWRVLSHLGGFFKGAHKHYVKLDLQGRLEDFAKRLDRDAPFLAGTRVRIEWVDESVTRRSFLEDDRIVIRLKREDREESNFVHGAYLFVSTSLVAKAKRYISKSQRTALDLFATTKVLEREKPSALTHFVDEYLLPETTDPESKVSKYVDQFAAIDSGGLFNPIVLQELTYLGEKVFGRRQDDRIMTEVDSLIDFMEPVAGRRVGDTSDLNFHKDYCRFAIVIVGKRAKVSERGHIPYLTYIQSSLFPRRIETVYVLGLSEHRSVIDIVSEGLSEHYETVRTTTSSVNLRYDNTSVTRKQYLAVLRLRGIPTIQSST